MIRVQSRIAIIVGLALAFASLWLVQKVDVSASATQPNRAIAGRAQLNNMVSVHAARRGFPYVNLSDGHDLRAAFDKSNEVAAQPSAAQANGLSPLAMTSTDLDEDGVADLVCSYDSAQGASLAIYRGNVDAINPHTAEANLRKAQGVFTESPFLASARSYAAPVAGELIVAGDMDGDGHQDIVIAARGSYWLYFLAGDGKGGISPAKQIALPGALTALAAGDINRRDGITDLIVGITGDSGPRALMFEGQRGGLSVETETFALPGAASDFAIGQFDNDAIPDIAIATGHSLLTIYGRERKLSAGLSPQHPKVQPPTISKRDFAFQIKAITSGKFSNDPLSNIGLLAEDGAIYLLHVKNRPVNNKAKKRAPQWSVEKHPATAQSNSTHLLTARLSSQAADALLLLDKGGQQVRIIQAAAGKPGSSLAGRNATVDFDVEGEAIAALPMRLNADALDDLVILRRGESAPTIMISAPAQIFTVTNIGDNGGVDPSPGAGTGTLRQAIVDANTNAGADTIQFNIANNLQTINLAAALPVIIDAVTIDGTTQPVYSGTPLIELNGAGAGSGARGLDIQASNVAVRALIINRFDADGISISGSISNVAITGSFIGTDATGHTDMGNGQSGITIFDVNGCTIGGTAAGAGNLISGNDSSGLSLNSNSVGTQVQGNLIGTDVTGTADLGNSSNGISLNINATIGGTTAAARNLISGNEGRGIFIQGSPTGALIQGNFIGTEITGTTPLANGAGIGYGDTTGGVTIGGTSAGAGNRIAFNTGTGIDLSSGGGGSNAFLGNSIFSNGALGIDINSDGVTANDDCDGDGGANGTQNFPLITSVTPGTMVTIQGTLNSIGSQNFRIEFFKNASCDASGNGEGQTFLGSTNVTTDAGCNAVFNVMLSAAVASGDVITATATDSANNTSEFSPCFLAPAAPGASLFIEFDADSNSVLAGNNITYNILVGNLGPDTATNAVVSEAVPANTTFQSISAPGGWNCSTPAVGATGTITCTNPSLANGAMAAFTIDVKINPSTPAGTIINATASINSATPDPDPSNNSGNFAVTVNTQADIAVVKTDAPDPVASGGNLTYTIVVSNTGPSTASGVTLNDVVPDGTTFVSLSSSGSCTTPPLGGTGAINCLLGNLAPGAPVMATLIVNVNSAPGTMIMNTATITADTMDENPANNSSTTSTLVSMLTCTIGCPADISVNTDSSQCGAIVNYPAPTTSGNCSDVVCTPPTGAFFPRGSTTVTCSATGTPSCSFMIRVNDVTPPVISCPGTITVGTDSDKNTAVVDYVPATATDACGVANTVCLPPSGSTFPLGISTVTCTAIDQANNQATCSFTVTVADADAPSIRCPNNISMELPEAQTSVVINYPPPTVTDNLPGVTVTCAPPSGATFPLGTTTVTCVAVDVTGNRATCSFSVSLTGGPPLLDVIIPTGKPALEFGTDDPVPVTRKNKNRGRGPCAAFTVVNRSFGPLNLTLDAILRIGRDVDNQRITAPQEGGTYSLSIVGANGGESALDVGETVAIARGGRVNFCLRFSPVVPGVAGKNSQLSAPQVIPDLIKSRVIFRVAGTSTLSVDVNAIVDTALQLINPNNPKKPATVTFTRSGDEFMVTFAVYDANLDVTQARYEFLDTSGAIISGPFDVDLTQAIAARNLVRGQSFTVTQRFTGADSNRQISLIRVTVFDSQTSVTSPSTALGTAAASVTVQAAGQLRFETVIAPAVQINRPRP